MNQPDPKMHQIVSFVKSGALIVGYALILIDINMAVSTLVLSEVIGIVEELV